MREGQLELHEESLGGLTRAYLSEVNSLPRNEVTDQLYWIARELWDIGFNPVTEETVRLEIDDEDTENERVRCVPLCPEEVDGIRLYLAMAVQELRES